MGSLCTPWQYPLDWEKFLQTDWIEIVFWRIHIVVRKLISFDLILSIWCLYLLSLNSIESLSPSGHCLIICRLLAKIHVFTFSKKREICFHWLALVEDLSQQISSRSGVCIMNVSWINPRGSCLGRIEPDIWGTNQISEMLFYINSKFKYYF